MIMKRMKNDILWGMELHLITAFFVSNGVVSKMLYSALQFKCHDSIDFFICCCNAFSVSSGNEVIIMDPDAFERFQPNNYISLEQNILI